MDPDLTVIQQIEPLPTGPQTGESTATGLNALGSGSQAADRELQQLLRWRLLIFCSLGTWGYGITVFTRLLNLRFHLADPTHRHVFFTHTFAFIWAVLILAVLIFGKRLSVSRLRRIELLILTIASIHAATKLYIPIPAELRNPDAQNLWATADIIQWFAIITFYGYLVPNTLRRAAIVIGVIVLVAVSTMLLSWSRYGLTTIPVGWYVNIGVYLGVTPVLAVFTIGRLEAYRQAAAEARELGQYRLGNRLGGGGMGEVFLAEHRLLKRPCAVKLIRAEKAADETFVRRFEREVQAATRLTHPAAVQVYDYGRGTDGTLYYVMEYLPGFTLEQVIRRSGPMPAARAVFILRQIAGALAEAHGLGLIHRDVKPGNVMLCRLGGRADAAKLLDFGLVAEVGPNEETKLTQSGNILGTPAYMSPEQARGGDVGPLSDLYSLGALGYFLITGRPPFGGRNALETLHATLTSHVIPPRELIPAIPPDVEALLMRLLAREPEERYGSATEAELILANCSCADGWTEAEATRWWTSIEPVTCGTPTSPA